MRVVADALLETKFYAPPRRRAVERRRLLEQLRRVPDNRLTLVSAPAGFGKTTLLAELAADPPADTAVAWLSLDEGDDDARVFWSYVFAALDRVAPGLGAGASAALEATDGRVEPVLTALVNDLAASPRHIVLVLDDYHLADSLEIQRGMAFLVEHLPVRGHVVIGTRADPALPLARYRARGELVELRAADLRFPSDEAATYLNDVMGLTLRDTDIAALEDRTEGWIAALQLAALSLQGRQDVTAFIADFTGDDRYIVDYLVEEVLQRQAETVRTFLLQTSILGRLSASLCDAVTDRADGSAMLDALDRSNLFLVPLDDRRRWYRYHHLFAEVLQARLLDERPGEAAALHRRASDWYGRAGDPAEAIRHALAAPDHGRAADLIEATFPELQRLRQESTLRDWLEALPGHVFGERPVLAAALVGARMSTGTFESVEELLDLAERGMDGGGQVIVANDVELRRLPSTVARYRAAIALARGDVAATIEYGSRARDRAEVDDHLGHGAGGALIGLALWARGDLEAAYAAYADGMASLERGRHLADVVGGKVTLADIRIGQGRLGEALELYREGLALAQRPGIATLRGAADMHVGIADVLLLQDDLQEAAVHLAASRQLGELNGLPKYPWRSRAAQARLRHAEGDVDGALDLLAEAGRVYTSDFSPDVRPIAAERARLSIVAGRLSDGWAWARERGVTAGDDPTYLGEFELTVLARLLLAQATRDATDGRSADAAGLIDRLLAAADRGERGRSVVEILVLQSLARWARRDSEGAITSLARAFKLAAPETYVRAFLDEREALAPVLQLLRGRPHRSIDGRELLARIGTGRRRDSGQRQPLVEPLSERELEVLRLLQGDLDGPDIARHLSVSLNTMRTHTKNIYAKLGVTSRRAAVRRAAELDLLKHR